MYGEFSVYGEGVGVATGSIVRAQLLAYSHDQESGFGLFATYPLHDGSRIIVGEAYPPCYTGWWDMRLYGTARDQSCFVCGRTSDRWRFDDV